MDHLEYKESLPQNEHVSLMYMYLGVIFTFYNFSYSAHHLLHLQL